MKKIFFLQLAVILFLTKNITAQIFSPIATSNYSLDAVAEFTPSTISTGGSIDGSNYVMYSVAYGTLFPGATGLPNSGLVSSGTRTYQLQPYSGFNTLFMLSGQTDSLIFNTPASYAALSVLGFATEGTGTMNVTVRFTDNTTAVFPSIAVPDWFAASPSVLAGFDRCNRTTGTPGLAGGQPKMFNADFILNCAQRAKLVKNIKFQNTGVNPRLCIMAASGAPMPTFTVSTVAVNCVGGTNGSASITATGGLAPYAFTVSSNPPQMTANAVNLTVGVYSYSAQDAAGCPITSTFAITQSLVPQPPIVVTSNIYTVCAGGSSFLGASGANTFTWSTGSTLTIINVTPNITTNYTVAGYTTDNCFRTGSLVIVVNPLPQVSCSPISPICVGAPCTTLTGTPVGGVFSGLNVINSTFCPSQTGSFTLSYIYTAPNSCSNTATVSAQVNPLPIVNFSFNPSVYCLNSPTVSLNGSPAGGVYTGAGINGASFSPSLAGVGTSSASYSYTDANGCSSSAISSVAVNVIPTLTFSISKTFYCINSTNVTLSALPSGGIFSGPGINLNSFSPTLAGVGIQNISYSYTNANNCSAAKTLTVNVSACTGLDNLFSENQSSVFLVYPNPSRGSFTIKSEINLEIIIHNELGQEVKNIKLNSSNNYMMAIDGLNSGVYFICHKNSSGSNVTKIIITD